MLERGVGDWAFRLFGGMRGKVRCCDADGEDGDQGFRERR